MKNLQITPPLTNVFQTFEIIKKDVKSNIATVGNISKHQIDLYRTRLEIEACQNYHVSYFEYINYINKQHTEKMKTLKTKTPIELFNEYEGLTKHYASKLFNISLLGYEFEDVVQEYRIKLYQVILTYLKNSKERLLNNQPRLTPISVYIKGALSNFTVDFMEKISKQGELFIQNSQETFHDYSTWSDDQVDINTDKNEYRLNGVDILAPLEGLKKAAFVMHLKGSKINEVKRVYSKHFNVEQVISEHKKFLRENREKYMIENKSEYFVSIFEQQ